MMNYNRNKEQIRGMITGFVIGDSIGMPVFGIKFPNQIPDYPLQKYVDPITSKFIFLKKGQYTFLTDIFLYLVESFVFVLSLKDKNDIGNKIFNSFGKVFREKEMTKIYSGVDLFYYHVFQYFVNKVNRNVIYSTPDKFSIIPIVFVLPFCILNDDKIFDDFWKLQKEKLNMSYYTSEEQYEIYKCFSNIFYVDRKTLEEKSNVYKKRNSYEKMNRLSFFLYGIYDCLSTTDNFKDAIVKAINEYSIYSNYISCIVGAISGFKYGFENIDSYYLNNFNNNYVILELSDKLFEAINVSNI